MMMLAFSMGAVAQVNNGIPQKNVEHLKFQGIPITGSMKLFHQKLTQKGYKFSTKIDGQEVFKGRYMGRNVEVSVYQDAGIVCAVEVTFLLGSKSEAYELQGRLLGALRQKYPRLKDSDTDNGTFDDGYGGSIDQYVTYVPRETRGSIDYKNLLGEFVFSISDIPMGDYSYMLEFRYVDEYNLPEWRAARKEYMCNKKDGMEL